MMTLDAALEHEFCTLYFLLLFRLYFIFLLILCWRETPIIKQSISLRLFEHALHSLGELLCIEF